MERSFLGVLGPTLLAVLNGAFALPDPPQPPRPAQVKPQNRQIQGQIVRMDSGQLVVKTRENEHHTLRVRPQTRVVLRDKVVQFNDLRVGANVNVVLVPQGEEIFAESVTVVEELGAPADQTLIEGEIVRVVGEEQVIVRTTDRREVIVFVDPRTKFLLEDRAGRFTDLRVGANVRAHVNVHDGRHMATQIHVPPRRR